MSALAHATRLADGAASDELASSPAPECFARNRYFDRQHERDAVKLLPGEYYVATRDMLLVTVLGSCVAACIRDTRTGHGGMNHFMLPASEGAGAAGSAARYGVYAMEILINHLLKLGAQREFLEAKVFGGGNVMPGLTQANVGPRNAAFVRRFLATESIRVAAQDLVDVHPRKVYFFPHSGRVLIKRLRVLPNDAVLVREADYRQRLHGAADGAVELFE